MTGMCVESFEAGYSKTLMDIDREIRGITGEVKAKFPGGLASEVAEEYEQHIRRLLVETFDRRAEERRTANKILRVR